MRKGRERRPELKAVDPKGLALPILQRIGGTGETGLLLGQQVGRGKHPASNPSSSKLAARGCWLPAAGPQTHAIWSGRSQRLWESSAWGLDRSGCAAPQM